MTTARRSFITLAAGFLVALVAGAAVPVTIASAQAPDPRGDVEVIIAIDASESMERAIGPAKAAANEFVASMPPDLAIGVVTFADTVSVLTAPTTDQALIRQQIDSIVTGGDTALYDVVVLASSSFTPAAEHKVLVVLSDGADEGSTATLEQAVAAVEGVQVEAISLSTRETALDGLRALGPVTAADDDRGVAEAFARIAALIVDVVEPAPTTTTAATAATPAAPSTTTTPTPTTTAEPTTAAPPSNTEVVAAAAAAAAGPSSPDESSTSTKWLWLGASGIFGSLFLLAVMFFPQQRVSRARLNGGSPRRASEMGVRATSAIEEALERHGKRADLGNALSVADVSMKPAEFIAMVGIVAITGGLVGLLLGGPLVAVLVTAVVCLAVWIHVRRATTKHRAAFADQLSDVLQLVTTALRSGHGITQALESVAEEAEEPARSEFAHVLVEARLGRSLSDSMYDLAERMQSKDLEWVVAAIDINRDTGGNLSEILSAVGATIRERARVARQVRTLTAEGRLSARILGALPIVLLVWQWRVNPDNFALMTQGLGLIALVVSVILIAVGMFWVRRLVNSVAL